jgi:hypothetical protein
MVEPKIEALLQDELSRKRAKIVVNNRQLRATTEDCFSAIRSANNPPVLFARTGELVRIQVQETGRNTILLANEDIVRHELTRVADFYKAAKGEYYDCLPPSAVVRDILATPPGLWSLPQITRVIEAPTITSGGRVVQNAGYDSETQLFYNPDPTLCVPEIADSPCQDHIDVACALIEVVIGDFPFVNLASRANAIAVLLTIVCRPAIAGPTPLALFDAPAAGTGKSLCHGLPCREPRRSGL